MRDAAPALARNRSIVEAGQLLAAVPRFKHEEVRSGTWAAVRYARKRQKRLVVLWNDGEFTWERR